ncbi:Papain-like_cysteine peptidase superfamily [Hexamita inflata]|uniref:Papain-like cysteine peptidase superfamily n=1 Tax=Hexamita inflata TaxID=28002 RepID=A0AA86P410_9EUKA|nr:Papain-like cysteine peptidase superfamily [Hexamita inflata]
MNQQETIHDQNSGYGQEYLKQIEVMKYLVNDEDIQQDIQLRQKIFIKTEHNQEILCKYWDIPNVPLKKKMIGPLIMNYDINKFIDIQWFEDEIQQFVVEILDGAIPNNIIIYPIYSEARFKYYSESFINQLQQKQNIQDIFAMVNDQCHWYMLHFNVKNKIVNAFDGLNLSETKIQDQNCILMQKQNQILKQIEQTLNIQFTHIKAIRITKQIGSNDSGFVLFRFLMLYISQNQSFQKIRTTLRTQYIFRRKIWQILSQYHQEGQENPKIISQTPVKVVIPEQNQNIEKKQLVYQQQQDDKQVINIKNDIKIETLRQPQQFGKYPAKQILNTKQISKQLNIVIFITQKYPEYLLQLNQSKQIKTNLLRGEKKVEFTVNDDFEVIFANQHQILIDYLHKLTQQNSNCTSKIICFQHELHGISKIQQTQQLLNQSFEKVKGFKPVYVFDVYNQITFNQIIKENNIYLAKIYDLCTKIDFDNIIYHNTTQLKDKFSVYNYYSGIFTNSDLDDAHHIISYNKIQLYENSTRLHNVILFRRTMLEENDICNYNVEQYRFTEELAFSIVYLTNKYQQKQIKQFILSVNKYKLSKGYLQNLRVLPQCIIIVDYRDLPSLCQSLHYTEYQRVQTALTNLKECNKIVVINVMQDSVHSQLIIDKVQQIHIPTEIYENDPQFLIYNNQDEMILVTQTSVLQYLNPSKENKIQVSNHEAKKVKKAKQ